MINICNSFSNMKVLLFSIIIVSLSVPIYAQFGGGSGTQNDPWLIETSQHLDNVRNYTGADHTNKYFLQSADIDLSGYANWIPIGGNHTSAVVPPFNGKYNGGGYEIRNMRIRTTDNGHQIGLFGQLGDANIYARVENVVLVNVDIIGGWDVGGLAGQLYWGVIENCSVSGRVEAQSSCVGGLIGRIIGWTGVALRNSSSSANVFGLKSQIGGLIGRHSSSVVENCFATGNVTLTGASGERNYYGGLIGWSYGGSISKCYASGNVLGHQYVGGLIGFNERTPVSQSSATGSVYGRYKVGGFIGEATVSDWTTAISNCYATGNTEAWYMYAGGFIGENNFTVRYCYSTGLVTGPAGDNRIGGFVGNGRTTAVSIFDSYWNTETSGWETSGRFGSTTDFGLPRTTNEMTFPYSANTYSNWNFNSIWTADNNNYNNGYPFLQWQIPTVTTIVVSGESDLFIPIDDAVTVAYSAVVYDGNNNQMPDETVSWELADIEGDNVNQAYINISENSGIVTVNPEAVAGIFRVTAVSDTDNEIFGFIDVSLTLSPPMVYSISIARTDGMPPNEEIIIPLEGVITVAYDARVYDQYGNHLENETVVWSLEEIGGDNDYLSIDNDGIVSIDSAAGEVTFLLVASSFSTPLVRESIYIDLIPYMIEELNTPIVQIFRNENIIYLEWEAIEGANSYKIYTSDNPVEDIEEWGEPIAVIDGDTMEFSEVVTNTLKFYLVVASTDDIE